jgi:hypothetical protein
MAQVVLLLAVAVVEAALAAIMVALDLSLVVMVTAAHMAEAGVAEATQLAHKAAAALFVLCTLVTLAPSHQLPLARHNF